MDECLLDLKYGYSTIIRLDPNNHAMHSLYTTMLSQTTLVNTLNTALQPSTCGSHSEVRQGLLRNIKFAVKPASSVEIIQVTSFTLLIVKIL